MAQELHTARVRGEAALRLVTGRGWGNLRQQPVLRPQVEEWLRGPEARALGVRGHAVVAKGGALDVRLGDGAPGSPRRAAGDGDGYPA